MRIFARHAVSRVGTRSWLILVILSVAPLVSGATLRRIVSASPAFTEMLFAIGAGDRVVGVTDYCRYPAAAARCEKIGGYADMNFEKLLAVKPDLVVFADYASRMREQCVAAKFATLELKAHSVADILDAIERLGRATGCEKKARAVAGNLRGELEKIRAATAKPPRRTLLIVGRTRDSFQNLLSVGPGGFLNDLLLIAGGVNALGDTRQPWPQINLETVMARRPEVIVEIVGEAMGDEASAADVARRKREWAGFSSIPAVAAGRVSVLTSDHALIPGPRLVDTARALAELLR
jgi:iron complex transport system substrate-binding protein